MSNGDVSGRNPDYEESSSVAGVHSSVRREKNEPLASSALIPWWYFILVGLVLMAGSLYLGGYNGGFRMSEVYAVANYTPAPRPQAPGTVVVQETRPWIDQWMDDGKAVFSTTCIACHQATGQGLPGMFPPLVGSEYVLGGSERMVAIVMGGVQGPITVKGMTYGATMMPPQGLMLTDEKIAQVLTYVRRSWGNNASVVTEEMVAAGRKKYGTRTQMWTEAELKALPQGDLPGQVPDLKTGKAPAAAAAK